MAKGNGHSIIDSYENDYDNRMNNKKRLQEEFLNRLKSNKEKNDSTGNKEEDTSENNKECDKSNAKDVSAINVKDKKDIKKLRTKLNDKDLEIQRLKKENSKLRGKIRDTEVVSNEKEKRILGLNGKIVELEKCKAEHERIINDLNKDLKDSEVKITSIQGKRDFETNLIRKTIAKSKRLKYLENSNRQNMQEFEMCNSYIKSLENTIKQLRLSNERYREIIKPEKEEVVEYTARERRKIIKRHLNDIDERYELAVRNGEKVEVSVESKKKEKYKFIRESYGYMEDTNEGYVFKSTDEQTYLLIDDEKLDRVENFAPIKVHIVEKDNIRRAKFIKKYKYDVKDSIERLRTVENNSKRSIEDDKDNIFKSDIAGFKILLVSSRFNTKLKKELTKKGVDVTIVDSYSESLRILDGAENKFDVVIILTNSSRHAVYSKIDVMKNNVELMSTYRPDLIINRIRYNLIINNRLGDII